MAFCLLFASCTQNNKLIGKWEFVNEDASMTIYNKEGVIAKGKTDTGEDDTTFKTIKSFNFDSKKVHISIQSSDGSMGMYSIYTFLSDSTINVRLANRSADLKFEIYNDTLMLTLSHDYGADDPALKEHGDSTITGYNFSRIGYYKKVKQ